MEYMGPKHFLKNACRFVYGTKIYLVYAYRNKTHISSVPNTL